ncbi:hypothetical protein C7212DRAFT_179794 [Tuber magnatum]|uniref:Uncharacterized protein n=1 Tax=Tuber magnatum TaxID=42249 RepID=A0A317SVL6_9PEZI|nr:hypothetical protein C7212DRAFT_179794 [Tuber magnatum]
MNYYLNDGLEGVERRQYRDARSFTRAINSQADKLGSGNLNSGQYAVFSPVSQDQLTNLECIRDTRYKSLRFLYLNDAETLIVKMTPGPAHIVATSELAKYLIEKLAAMGLHRALHDMRAAAYQGVRSKKEADTALKPSTSRPRRTGWPTVVFECGILESQRRLRADARWWLENSARAVNTVLLISVSEPGRNIHLEQWGIRSTPNPYITKGRPHPLSATPTKINDIDMDGDTVTGPPLRLAFDEDFLRPPASGEGDIVFTVQDLRDYSNDVWSGME